MPPERARAAGWPLAAAAALLALADFLIFRPGVITPDTVFQYGQALTARYDDWHPPVTAWVWRMLMLLFGRGTAPVLLFDLALYWSGAALVALALRREGRRGSAWIALLVAALPIPFGQMGAILKDPLLTACCLAALGLCCWLGGRRDWPMRPIATLLLVLGTATRFNAFFATLPLALLLWPKRVPLFVTIPVTAFALVLSTWLIDTVALRPNRAQPFFSLVNFDFAGIIANGGPNLYPFDARTAQGMTAHCYTPALYNPKNDESCYPSEEALAATGKSPIRLWLSGIAQAPLPWLRHRIAHANRNWRFLVRDVPDDAFYIMSEPNDYGLAFRAGPAAVALEDAARTMALSPLGRPATWMAISLGLLLVARRLRPLVVALAASSLLYGLGYAVVSVSTDLRYNLWTMLAGILALVIADVRRLPRPALLTAAAPALIVVAAELVWFVFALPPFAP